MLAADCTSYSSTAKLHHRACRCNGTRCAHHHTDLVWAWHMSQTKPRQCLPVPRSTTPRMFRGREAQVVVPGFSFPRARSRHVLIVIICWCGLPGVPSSEAHVFEVVQRGHLGPRGHSSERTPTDLFAGARTTSQGSKASFRPPRLWARQRLST